MAETTTPNDQIVRAIDTIVKSRIANLDFDKTVICTITDDSDKDNGHYVVNDGSISFDAYSENTEYAANDSVYVTIPRGDYTQNKVIVSKYVANANDQPLRYTSPLDQMFIVSNNLVTQNTVRDNGIVANGTETTDGSASMVAPGKFRLIWERDLSRDDNASLKNNAMFDCLGIKASFQCALGTTYNIKSGHYGIIIELYSTPSTDLSSAGAQQSTYILDTADMFGNPYLFLTSMEQSKLINISNLGDISKINMYLFQSSDFTYLYEDSNGDISTERVPNKQKLKNMDGSISEVECEPNIWVDNVEVYFGMNLANVVDNSFVIYSASPSTYDMIAAEEDDSVNIKDILPVWFNKSEDNEYLGFSDGIYSYRDFHDLNGSVEPVGRQYDEREYLKQAEYISRGAKLNQQSLIDLNIPPIQELLQIYSYGQSIQAILKKLPNQIGSKVNKAVNQLASDLRGYQTSGQQNTTTGYRDALSNNSSYINCVNIIQDVAKEENSTCWMNNVINVLKNYGSYYIGQTSTVPNATNQYNILNEKITTVETAYNNFKTVVDEYFANVKTQVNDDVLGVYDIWETSKNKVFDTCDEYLTGIMTLLRANEKDERDCIRWQLTAISNKFANTVGSIDDYNTTKANFDNSYAQRYAIYWYKYNPGYKSEDEKFLPANWELIEDRINNGLPEDGEYTDNEDGNKYWVTRSETNQLVQIKIGDKYKTQERVCAVLIYDHQVYKSNILTYVNANPALDDMNADTLQGLYIATTNYKVSDTEYDDDGNPVVEQEDTYNNQETYQLYGMTGYLVNQAEAFKRRTLRARFGTAAGKLGDNYLAKNCMVYWYIPLHSTMLKVQHEDLVAAGFSVYDPEYERSQATTEQEIAGINPDSMTLTELQNALTGSYATQAQSIMSSGLSNSEKKNQLSGLYLTQQAENTKTNNQKGSYNNISTPFSNNYQEGYIMAWKKIEANDLDPDTVKVESTEFFYQIKDYYIPSFTNNTIKCRVVKDSQYIYDAETTFTFASFGSNGTDYSLCFVPATNQSAVRNDSNLHLKVAVYDVNGDLMEDETNNIEVSWLYNYGNTAILGGAAPDIYISRANSSTTFGYAILQAQVDVSIKKYSEAEQTSAEIIANAEAASQEDGEETSPFSDNGKRTSRTVTLSAYYPVPWAADDYYIEGPTTVVYDSGGSNPVYYNGPYRLFNGDKTSSPHSEITNITVDVSNPSYPRDGGVSSTITTLARELLPKIKYTDSNGANGKYELSVPGMFVINNDRFVTVEFSVGGSIVYVQPIYVLQNRFSSAMLNAWDGELTIDEKNGTILASMVGAGKKERDNTFSGVLMGDVAAKAEDASMGQGTQGVFGFNHGEQAFAFKNDGTGFIGKANKGRILFDGNKSTIQSMSYNTSKVGMMLDLDDGEIDMRGAYVDYGEQSAAWQEGAQVEYVDSETGKTQYRDLTAEEQTDAAAREGLKITVPDENQRALDNNEVNGYDNSTKYSSSGSRVTIKTRSPYFEIISPNQVVNTETPFKDSAKDFWSNMNMYDSVESIAEYMINVYDVHDAEFYYCDTVVIRPGEVNEDTGAVGTNFYSGSGSSTTSLPSTFPCVIRIAANVKYTEISNAIKNNLKNFEAESVKLTWFRQLSNGGTSSGSGEDETWTAKAYEEVKEPFAFFQGDGLYFESATSIVYIPKGNLRFSTYPNLTQFQAGVLVDKNGCVLSSIKDAAGNSFSLSNYHHLIDEEDGLANKIFAEPTNFEPEEGSEGVLNVESFGDNLKVRFLSRNDYNNAQEMYAQSTGGNTKPSTSLIKIGTDSYYLQTDDYHKATSVQTFMDGKGLKFDLKHGSIDAYKFNLRAADPGSGSYIALNSSGNPYFVVHHKQGSEVDLDVLKISKSEFYLQSKNWKNTGDPTTSSGTKIDIDNGRITSYDFDLKAYDKDQSNYTGSYVQISSSGNPYIRVHYCNTSEEKNLDLLTITRNLFILQSQNWNSSAVSMPEPDATTGEYDPKDIGTGMQINLNNGVLKAYNFSLMALNTYLNEGRPGATYGSYIKLDSGGNPFLQIHLRDTNYKFSTLVSYTDDGGKVRSRMQEFKAKDYNLDVVNLGVDLLKVTTKDFIIKSANYTTTTHTSQEPSTNNSQVGPLGFLIDVNRGRIEGYNAKLQFTGTTSTYRTLNKDGSITSNNDPNVAAEPQVVKVSKLGTLTIDSSDINTPFKVQGEPDGNGARTRFEVYWDGSIIATGGVIGGWRINNTSLWINGTNEQGLPNDTCFRLSAVDFGGRDIGSFTRSGDIDTNLNMTPAEVTEMRKDLAKLRIAISNKFAVTKDGVMFAKDGYFDGRIIAKSGYIGGWKINNNKLQSSRKKYNDDGTISSEEVTVVLDGENGKIEGAEITGSYISGGKITGAYISSGSAWISNGEIHGASIDGSKITGGSIDCNNLTASGANLTDSVNILGHSISTFATVKPYIFGSSDTFIMAQGDVYVEISGSGGGGTYTISGSNFKDSTGGTCSGSATIQVPGASGLTGSLRNVSYGRPSYTTIHYVGYES